MDKDTGLKKYTSGDMSDAHSLAKDDLWWMVTAFQHVTKELKAMSEQAKQNNAQGLYFGSLLDHLNMYEHLAQVRHDSHEKDASQYLAEWELEKEKLNIKAVA